MLYHHYQGRASASARHTAASVVLIVGRGLVCGDLLIGGMRWKVLYLPSI